VIKNHIDSVVKSKREHLFVYPIYTCGSADVDSPRGSVHKDTQHHRVLYAKDHFVDFEIEVAHEIWNWSLIPFNTPVSSTNKTDHHDRTEILVKVALNTIRPQALRLC
jgi:hypothetical protein